MTTLLSYSTSVEAIVFHFELRDAQPLVAAQKVRSPSRAAHALSLAPSRLYASSLDAARVRACSRAEYKTAGAKSLKLPIRRQLLSESQSC